MFEFDYQQATLKSLTTRSEVHGDEQVPAASLHIEIEAANTLLDVIDPTLRQALYKRVDAPMVDGQAATQDDAFDPNNDHTPVLRCNSIDTVHLPTKHEGWHLELDDNIDEADPTTFAAVKVDKLIVTPRQGGSISLRMRLGTNDVDEHRLGWLGMRLKQSIWIKLRAPKAQPKAIDGTQEDFDADHPPADDAGSLFGAAVAAQEAQEGLANLPDVSEAADAPEAA